MTLAPGQRASPAKAPAAAQQVAAAPAQPPATAPPPVSPESTTPPPPPQPAAASNPAPDAGPEAMAAVAAGAGQGCDMVQWVQDRLQRDPGVRAALQRIPVAERSVANAVQLWNGRWIEDPGGADRLAPVRAATVQAILASPPGCRQADVAGPRLILFDDGPETVILSLGSGNWRWTDLVVTAAMTDKH